jgi:hypothetical protein
LELPNRILIEFLGGDLDGAKLDSQSESPEEANWARNYFVITDGGAVGKSFKGYSAAAMRTLFRDGREALIASGTGRNHKYTVVDRIEQSDGDVVLLRMRYDGQVA